MAKIVRLNVMIGASSKGMTAGIAAAQKSLKSLSREAKIMQRNISKAFSPAVTQGISMAGTALKAIGASAVAGAVGLGYFAKTQIDAIGDTADLAQTLGLTYNGLQSVRLAAKLAGIDAEKLDAAFGKFTDTMGSALDGNKAAIDSFARLGLSMEDLQRMRPDQRFEAVASAIAKIKDPAQKFSAARDIFGKSGGALVNLFENSGQAINDAAVKLQQFGVLLSGLDISKVREAGDSMDTLSTILDGIGSQLAVELSPYITQISEDIQQWVADMGGVGPAMDTVFGNVADWLDSILDKISSITSMWNKFAGYVDAGVGWVADKAAKIGDYGANPQYGMDKELERRAQMIAPDKREAFKAAARASGGFANERVTVHGIANGLNAEARSRTAASGEGQSSTYGAGFRNWRANADANANGRAMQGQQQAAADAYNAKAQQIMQGAQSRGFVPSRQLPQTQGPWSGIMNELRGIRQNTAQNNVAYAG